MLLNNFIKQAMQGRPFIDRFKLYAVETNWENGEVVLRGCGSNFGEEGFLRPGFSYSHCLEYLYSKIIEHLERDQDVENIRSRDWLVKMASAVMPRGMGLNDSFKVSLYNELHECVFMKLLKEVKADAKIGNSALVATLEARYRAMQRQRVSSDFNSFWDEYLEGLGVADAIMSVLDSKYVFVARLMDQTCNRIIDFAVKAHLYNDRVSCELYNQPRPVDSIGDDFAVEAQELC
jgi:hypothetical protein